MTDKQGHNNEEKAEEGRLHGERIYLRRPTMEDAENVFQWENDDEIWQYDLERPHTTTLEDFLPIFERSYVRGNERQFWFIIENEQHLPIGTITYFNLKHINYDRRLGQVELGVGIGVKEQWGKAYGTEAISTLVNYIFTDPNIVCVNAEIAPTNQPARRAFTKAGFEEIGQSRDAWVQVEIWNPKGVPDVF